MRPERQKEKIREIEGPEEKEKKKKKLWV